MKTITRTAALALAGTLLLGGCVTRGALRRGLAEQAAALQSEREARIAGDSQLQQNLAALHTDLLAMRSEQWKFHVNGILFDFPPTYPVGPEWWPTLYDVVEDPREEYTVRNLHPDVVARLRPQLDAVAADVAAEAAQRATQGAPA